MQKFLALIPVAGAAIAGYSLAAFMANQTVAPAGIEIGGWTTSQIMNAIGMLLGGGGAVAALIKQLWPQAGPVIDKLQPSIDKLRERLAVEDGLKPAPMPVKPEWLRLAEAVQQLQSGLQGTPESAEPLEKLWSMVRTVETRATVKRKDAE